MTDFAGIASAALARAEELVPSWLPGGKRRGHEWVCGDITGAPGESFSVNLTTGQWADFAGDQKGGDLISLYAAIHGLSQLEAAGELDDGGQAAPTLAASTAKRDITPQRPPEAKFAKETFRHIHDGTPSSIWVYRDTEGPLFVVARYDSDGRGKQIRPWIWDGLKWHCKGYPTPRPLYGLDRLAKLGDKPVLLVEGEKTADAAQRLFPSRPCMTWPNGSKSDGKADWAPLRGKAVDIWPDDDPQGREAVARVATRLLGLGCAVRVIEPKDKGGKGWDLADDETEGQTPSQLVAYAKANIKTVEAPAAKIEPVKRAERKAAPGSQTLVQAAPRGSRVELWQRIGFETKGNSVPYNNMSNAVLAIRHAGGLGLHYDTFIRRVYSEDGEWSDAQKLMLTRYMQTELGMHEMSAGTVNDAAVSYAHTNQKNKAQDWMNGLPEWDRQDRLSDLLPVGFGSTVRTQYTADVGRCFMVGMVARIMKPGCKVDNMPVFEGRQGALKSSALAALGGEFFTEVHESITSKDFYIVMAGKFLCEISELSSFSTSEINRIKGVISNRIDRYRPPYGSAAQDFPRSCVFAGTTNDYNWNRDETGARRFWPVRCARTDPDWVADNREQLFAQALHLFSINGKWYDVDEAEATEQQNARRDVHTDPWFERVKHYCDGRPYPYVPDILADCLHVPTERHDVAAGRRVGKILRALNYEQRVARIDGDIKRRWQKRDM